MADNIDINLHDDENDITIDASTPEQAEMTLEPGESSGEVNMTLDPPERTAGTEH